jgi:F0F1-type ATP synthase delta subunit
VQSRTSVAKYAATTLLDGSVPRDKLIAQLAAWLKNSKNSRQSAYLIEDIAKKLAENGYIYVTVTTATTVTEDTKNQIVTFLQQHYGTKATFEIRENIQPKVIGGVRIDTPHGSIDATIKRTLIQIIKGV